MIIKQLIFLIVFYISNKKLKMVSKLSQYNLLTIALKVPINMTQK